MGKRIGLSVFVWAASLMATSGIADDAARDVWREPGKEWLSLETSEPNQDSGESGPEERDLRRRLRRLERAVRELQREWVAKEARETQIIHVRPPLILHAHRSFTCLLRTPLHGTFVARSDSLLEATAQVLQQCDDARAPFCKKSDVSCEQVIEP